MSETTKGPLLRCSDDDLNMLRGDIDHGTVGPWVERVLSDLDAQRQKVAEWINALDELHVENWIGVVDASANPREAVRQLLEMALDQQRDEQAQEIERLKATQSEVLAAIERYRSEFGKTELWKMSAYKQILDIIENGKQVSHV